jgi:hypothetical protein
MAKRPPGDVSEVLVLYLLNVSEPLLETDIVDSLRATQRFTGWPEDAIVEGVRKGLADLTAQGYAVQTLEGRYVLTYSGIQIFSERRVAFPRDKHRLYFLKEALRRRG